MENFYRTDFTQIDTTVFGYRVTKGAPNLAPDGSFGGTRTATVFLDESDTPVLPYENIYNSPGGNLTATKSLKYEESKSKSVVTQDDHWWIEGNNNGVFIVQFTPDVQTNFSVFFDLRASGPDSEDSGCQIYFNGEEIFHSQIMMVNKTDRRTIQIPFYKLRSPSQGGNEFAICGRWGRGVKLSAMAVYSDKINIKTGYYWKVINPLSQGQGIVSTHTNPIITREVSYGESESESVTESFVHTAGMEITGKYEWGPSASKKSIEVALSYAFSHGKSTTKFSGITKRSSSSVQFRLTTPRESGNLHFQIWQMVWVFENSGNQLAMEMGDSQGMLVARSVVVSPNGNDGNYSLQKEA